MQADGSFLFDSHYTLTVYDLPIYTPCVYVSQLAQYMDGVNVRVWKETTATEIVDTLLVMARYVRPDIETAPRGHCRPARHGLSVPGGRVHAERRPAD